MSDDSEDGSAVMNMDEEPGEEDTHSQQSTAAASQESGDGPSTSNGDQETGEAYGFAIQQDSDDDRTEEASVEEDPPIPIIHNNNHQEKEKGAVDSSEIEMTEYGKTERKAARERLFFKGDPSKRVDYVLAYEDTDDDNKMEKRKHFLTNLDEAGLDLEVCDKSDSVDLKTYFVLLNITWEALGHGAELLNMRKRIKMPKDTHESGACCTCDPFSANEEIVPSEDDYFTAPFHVDKCEMFDFDEADEESCNRFFSNAERSLVVKELLDRTSFTISTSSEQRFGIQKLLSDDVFKAAFPLHEGPRNPLPEDETPWEGKDKDRSRLYEAWARPGRWYCYQPLDLIRRYYGEKIAIYFAWLGYYTTALIPAALFGLAAFLYGLITLFDDQPSEDICDDKNNNSVGNIVMCPACDKQCDYFLLTESCIYAKITYVFDNIATVVFAIIMAIWAVCFLEFWKRYQNTLRYEWDVADFALEERMRPEFEFKVRKTRENPITKLREPYVGFTSRLCRFLSSYTIVLTMILVVGAAIFGVILYRIIVVVVITQQDSVSEYGSIITSITAAMCNLIAIIILNVLYGWIATKLTDLELNRTESEYESSLIFKIFLFKFVNFYGSTFYIAFFKGSFTSYPGSKRNYLFGQYRPDGCDPAGCMVDLFLHLAFIMIGKQALNNVKELVLPWFLKWCRARSSVKGETSTNLYMRWEQDYDYGAMNKLGLFEEYLEMVIQFGFVTLFVAAFPLAPLFALFNNIVEIRLDAFKFVSIWRRPHAAKAQGIGIWLAIMQGLSFLAILTNAFIIGWTSDFVPKLVYMLDNNGEGELDGYMRNSLSIFATKDFQDDQAPTNSTRTMNPEVCMYRGYREPYNVDNKYEYTREFYMIFMARLAVVIIFEHICFLITWFVSYAIPDTPASVERLRIYEKQLVKKMTFDKTFENMKEKRKSMRDVVANFPF